MDDIDFCPFCNAGGHKLMECTDSVLYCKECNRFFELKQLNPTCPRCTAQKVKESDFPMTNGEKVFQCGKCKKLFGSKEFLKHNKL